MKKLSVAWAALLLLLVSAVHFWLITYGTGDLTGYEIRGIAFDSLGRSLTKLEADVDHASINWEGFQIGHKKFIYYGPFPAMLRILPNKALPWMYGMWSRTSCLVASLLALLAFAGLAAHALRLNPTLTPFARSALLSASIVGFGLGTPLAYLDSCGRIYHEAVVWGLTGAMVCLYVVFLLLTDGIGENRGLFFLAIAVGVTLLSRLTFALPFVAAFALLWLRAVLRRYREAPPGGRRRLLLPVLLVAIPAVLAGVVQLWYNHARFGSVLRTIDFRYTYVHPEEIGGTFNPKRIPSALANYFGNHGLVSKLPPYFEVERVRYADDRIFFNWKEHTYSLTLSSSWLVLGALLGALWLVRPGIPWFRTIALMLLLLQVVVISAFYFVTQRYAAEYLPFLSLLFALFLARVPARGWLSWVVAVPLVLLALSSSVITLASTLHWNLMHNGDAPFSYKVRLGRLLTPGSTLDAWAGRKVFLDELEASDEEHSYRPFARNTVWDASPITFRGFLHDRGIGMHANSKVTFAVPAGATAFEAVVGLPDTVGSCEAASTVFTLSGDDGKELWKSGVVRNAELPKAIRVDLRGSRTLTIAVTDNGDGINCDHGTWAMAAFLIP